MLLSHSNAIYNAGLTAAGTRQQGGGWLLEVVVEWHCCFFLTVRQAMDPDTDPVYPRMVLGAAMLIGSFSCRFENGLAHIEPINPNQ